ncbi:DNA-directed RNA polymerase subunit beta [Paenibacillus aestuarii]|uniref:DNA-directed RNA polymerase subunit beta n=1 Tax=Paenibacillus aestuarii TaxID=516965 RepID=A0ABW0KF96_9BACL|nr:DNA-directed RNA polymerase subunit beta [Paenibacillus aestuarii]
MSDKPVPKSKQPQAKWLKITWTVFKIFRVPVLAVLAVYIGLWIGYTKFGHQPASEILHMSTWRHLYDLVFAS